MKVYIVVDTYENEIERVFYTRHEAQIYTGRKHNYSIEEHWVYPIPENITRYVVFQEPDGQVEITEKEAITRQRLAGIQVHGYDPYLTDEAALNDYMDIHWATFKDDYSKQ